MKHQMSQRHQTSLLSPLESPLLQWIARRLPDRVSPDHLTLLGLFAMVGAGVGYALSGYQREFLHLVNLFLFLNWFGDSLDGTLARVREKLRPRYGFYVDHIIDSVGVLCLMAGLGWSGLMSPIVAVGVLVAYLMISIDSYLAAHTLGKFRISYFKFSPTELRILLAVGNLVAIGKSSVGLFGERFLLFDVGGAVAVAAMTLTLAVSIGRNTWALYQMERV